MGWFSDFLDDVIGIDPPKPPPAPKAPSYRQVVEETSRQVRNKQLSLERMVGSSRRRGRRQLVSEQDVAMRLT